jgi:uncharacterized RDD family membrane protein YckC
MLPTTTTSVEETDVLNDIQPHYQQASQGKRFGTYLIDLAFFYAFQFALGFLLAYFFLTGLPSITGVAKVDSVLYSWVMYVLLYFVIESLFKGKTLGKLITGTRAVNVDGSAITSKQAFIRSISRLVPFEGFTGLKGSNPTMWHDSWANTVVIDEKLSGGMN